MTELKPCPFCGGKAALSKHPTIKNLVTCADVHCGGYAVEMVPAEWNTRAAIKAPVQEPVTDETAALRAKLAEVERAAYERGVREAAAHLLAIHERHPQIYHDAAAANILALLPQEGR